MKNNLVHRFLIKCVVMLVAFMTYSTVSAQTMTLNLKAFNNSSATATSKLTYNVVPGNGWFTGISTITNTVLRNKRTNAIVYSTTAQSNVSHGTIPTSLAPEFYELTITLSTYNNSLRIQSFTLVQTIWIGNKVMWENCFDMEPGISQYSMKRSRATSGQTYSYAVSFNSLPVNTFGWVEMQKPDNITNDSRVFLVLEPLTDPRTFTPSSNITYLEFFRDNSTTTGVRLKYKSGTSYITTLLSGTGFIPTDKVRFVRNSNGTCVIEATTSGNARITLFTFPALSTINPTGGLKFTLLSKQLNDQADNIITSYAYPNTNYPISSAFGANNSYGTMTLRINPFSTGFTNDYNYFVSMTPMEDMKTIYKYLKDSISTTGVDSTTFLGGSTTSKTFTFNNLPLGTYYANAFDGKGVRIFSNRMDMVAPYVYGQISQFETSESEFLSTSPDSYVTLNRYVTEEDKATISFEVTNLIADQSFGVLPENELITVTGGSSHSKIKYGFKLISGGLHYIVNGATISIGAQTQIPSLQLVFGDGKVDFIVNGVVSRTELIAGDFQYKIGAYVKSWGQLMGIKPTFLSTPPYKIRTKITNATCNSTSANVQFLVTGFNGQSVTMTGVSLVNITDDQNQQSMNVTITNGSTHSLANGVYSFQINNLSIGGVSQGTVRHIFYVGSKAQWDPYVNIETWPMGNTATNFALATGSVAIGNPARAISTNKLNPQTSGWTVMSQDIIQPVNINNTIQFPSTRFSLSQSPMLASLGSTSETAPNLVHILGLYIVLHSGAGNTINAEPLSNYIPTIPFLVVREQSGLIKYRQPVSNNVSNVLFSVANYPSQRWMPSYFNQARGKGIRDVVTSYPCVPLTSDLFAQLKYEMDGYYHIMKNGEIKFVFNQEYNDANLTFNLYNSNDILIKTQADFPIVATTNGMNYITLDVRNTPCIGSGFFYLEVINSKKEKMYLRFYNDFTGCTPPMEGQNGGIGNN